MAGNCFNVFFLSFVFSILKQILFEECLGIFLALNLLQNIEFSCTNGAIIYHNFIAFLDSRDSKKSLKIFYFSIFLSP